MARSGLTMSASCLCAILVAALAVSCTRGREPAPAPPPASAPALASALTPAPTPTHAYRKRHRTAPAGTHVGKAVPGEALAAYTRLLNPTDAAGNPVFARGDDACFYETPTSVPAGVFPPMGWRGRDRHDVDCPAAMDDAAWDECAPGEIRQDPATGRCMCEAVESVMGPSTPRNAIACPVTPQFAPR